MANSKRAAHGSGTIRKKTVTRNGQDYTYWEARITTGYDAGTGRQKQRSVTGKTQKEVREKLQALAVEVNNGTYQEPCRMTLGEWLDIWVENYLGACKPRTKQIYESDIRVHIKPALGAVRMENLLPHTVQTFYNALASDKADKPGLSAKTIKNIHGVLHQALKQAVLNGYIRTNPSDACTLPRGQKAEIKPLDEDDVAAFIRVIQGHPFEDFFLTTLFLGLREGEALGLTWDCVNLDNGVITVNKQLQLHQEKGLAAYELVPTKNSRSRTLVASPTVVARLRHRKAEQTQQRLMAGCAWEDSNLVFTDTLGHHLTKPTVYRHYKKAVAAIGRPDARYHDLRHSYAVAAISSGIDIKTVQGNLGHATAAFTLDVYGHVTDRMKRESADKMEDFIRRVSGD